MKKPLIINSSVEFVIVGPIFINDGIIIQSANVGIDLVGAAYRIYRSEYLAPSTFRNLGANFIWSEATIPTVSNKKSKILFFWRKVAKKIYNQNSTYIPRIENDINIIQSEFENFIENSYTVLKSYSISHINDDSEHIQHHSIIFWNIASLLLECATDYNLL